MVVCFVTKTSLELKEIIKMRHCTRPPLDYSPTYCALSLSRAGWTVSRPVASHSFNVVFHDHVVYVLIEKLHARTAGLPKILVEFGVQLEILMVLRRP